MKLPLFLAATMTASLISFGAHAASPSGPSFATGAPPPVMAGLAWRCGKNNPAEWGTFGNGCLKQKRAAKNGASSAAPEMGLAQ